MPSVWLTGADTGLGESRHFIVQATGGLQQRHCDGRAAALESLTAIRRAGADIVLTYWAADAAGWLR